MTKALITFILGFILLWISTAYFLPVWLTVTLASIGAVLTIIGLFLFIIKSLQ